MPTGSGHADKRRPYLDVAEAIRLAMLELPNLEWLTDDWTELEDDKYAEIESAQCALLEGVEIDLCRLRNGVVQLNFAITVEFPDLINTSEDWGIAWRYPPYIPMDSDSNIGPIRYKISIEGDPEILTRHAPLLTAIRQMDEALDSMLLGDPQQFWHMQSWAQRYHGDNPQPVPAPDINTERILRQLVFGVSTADSLN